MFDYILNRIIVKEFEMIWFVVWIDVRSNWDVIFLDINCC